MDYGKREAGGPIWILYSHNPLISDLGYFVTRDFFKSFLVCKDLFICKDLFLILTAIGNEYEYWGKSFDDKFKTLCASRSSFPTPEHPTG